MIRFGPSGNSKLFYDQGYKHSLDAPLWLKNLGLNAYEYNFTRGVNMSETLAKNLGERCKKYNIEISVHAPYYINFASEKEELVEKSYGYILQCLTYLKIMGGKRCVFHPGSCCKLPREKAFELLKKRIAELIKRVKKAGFGDMLLCPETMGKHSQLGTYKEIAELCKIDKMLIPTADFGHINSLKESRLKNEEAFKNIINYLIDNIGLERVKKLHIHFSKIEYGDKGEIRHLTFADDKYGPNFEHLAKVLKEYKMEPIIICESRDCQAEEAKVMKNIYENTI